MVEKFYSVAAELAGGETSVLPVRGRTAGEAFQQAKTNPGVRRVGKVTEITPRDYEALQRGEIPAASLAPARRAPEPAAGNHASPEQPTTAEARAQLNAPLTGPRVVLHARPSGGEQPFRHLQAPPERPRPAQPKPQPQVTPRSQPQPAAASTSTQAPGAIPAAVTLKSDRPADASAAPAREYRIVKSRRQGGDPYLLQRGQWQDRAGKRTFTVDWEKGFPARPDAERHQQWLTHREQEMADLRRQAG